MAYASSKSLDDWTDTARRGEYRQAPEHQGAIDAIMSLLQGTIDSDRAASMIDSLYNPLLKRGFKLSPVPTLWEIICDAIRALGDNQDISERLVRLLNSISKLPDVMGEHGNAITPVRGRYWRDLPDLGTMFRDYAMGKFSNQCCGRVRKRKKVLLVPLTADEHDHMKQISNP